MMFCLLVLLACRALGFPRFAQNIPNGARVHVGKVHWPGVGHQEVKGGGLLNPFGEDFKAAGFSWTRDLCLKDSDGDGLSNGEELGDPNCSWVPTALNGKDGSLEVPGTISHPGIDDPAYKHSVTLSDQRCAAAEAKTGDRHIFALSEFHLPKELDGAYVCKQFTLNGGDRLEYLKAQAHVGNDSRSADVVHHMFLFGCQSEVKLDMKRPAGANFSDVDGPLWECNDMPQNCVHLRAGWGVGGGDFCTPPGVAMPLNTYLVLQMHYNNPDGLEGIVDSSGLVLHLSKIPMPQKAGVLLVGPVPDSDSIKIPARSHDHEIQETCPASQLEDHMPSGGLTVFGINLHMHAIGKSIKFEKKLPDAGDFVRLAEQLRYNYNDQSIVAVEESMQILPGEDLQVTCHYDSSEREKDTVGGTKLDQEMCFAIIVYYPLMPDYHYDGFPICFDFWSKIMKWIIIGCICAGGCLIGCCCCCARIFDLNAARKTFQEKLHAVRKNSDTAA